MNATCPNCATIYRIDPAKVPEGGVRARCAVCSAIFRVEAASASSQPRGTASARDTAAAPAQLPTGAGAVAPLPASEPARSPVQPPSPESVRVSADRETLDRQSSGDRPGAAAEAGESEPPSSATIDSAGISARDAAGAGQDASVETASSAADAPDEVEDEAHDSAGPEDRAGSAPAEPEGHPEASTGRAEGPDADTSPSAQGHHPPARQSMPPAFARPAGLPPRPAGVPASRVSSSATRPVAPPARTTPTPPPSIRPPARPDPQPVAAPPKPPAVARKAVNPFLSQDPSQKARRLARALISDMVVYHPAKRREGLRDGNLKELFDEEIKKSWEEYTDQVGHQLAESTTHFKDALNEILADGKQMF